MQAAATGFVGRTALTDRAAANGLYLTSYYIGGIAGSIALGGLYEIGGWAAVNTAILAVVAILFALARFLAAPGPEVLPRTP